MHSLIDVLKANSISSESDEKKENRNEKVGLEVHLGASIFPLIDIVAKMKAERDGYEDVCPFPRVVCRCVLNTHFAVCTI